MRMLIAAAVMPFAITVNAQEHKPVISGDSVQWGQAPSVFPRGAEMAVLHGDPSKSGLFIVRVKMPGGYRIAAHQHPTDEHITVISGSFHGGMGDKLEGGKGWN
jgi:quercetin dioxygenase-like cupin family protein